MLIILRCVYTGYTHPGQLNAAFYLCCFDKESVGSIHRLSAQIIWPYSCHFGHVLTVKGPDQPFCPVQNLSIGHLQPYVPTIVEWTLLGTGSMPCDDSEPITERGGRQGASPAF
jgi:hypothetical protein